MTITADCVDVQSYRQHSLHGGDRDWVETNCYVDVWIELLSQLGLPPEPACLTALSSDATPGQWSFLKFQVDDVRRLYDIEVGEMNVWRTVEEHVVEQLVAGQLCTLESDAWYLPDTAGISYRTEHVKTTIVPLVIDTTGRRLVYLHNAGRFELDGDDYVGALALQGSDTRVPEPYMESVRIDRRVRDLSSLPVRAVDLARSHLERAPSDNPVYRLGAAMNAELSALAACGMAYFHLYSFATTRQLGLSAQCAADGLDWLHRDGILGAEPGPALAEASAAFRNVSSGAKRLQFSLARIASGRSRPIDAAIDALATDWAGAMAAARRALLA